MKKLVVYLPLTWPQISTKVFTSFVDLVHGQAQNGLKTKHEIDLSVLIHDKFPLDRNRNSAVELMLSTQYNADYIFFHDADNVIPKGGVEKLLSHISDEFPIVSGIYFRKAPPHLCVAGHYSAWNPNLEMRRESLKEQGFIAPDGSQCLFYKPLLDFTTVQPIDVSGMGCLLVKADVFRKLEMPYFAYVNPYTNGGDFFIDHASEEMLFWAQCKKKGIKALVDPTVRCGHVAEVVIGANQQ